jgi:sulfate permease, SulP family
MTAPVTEHRLVFDSLAGYQQSWLRPDIIAGLTVWAVLIPESLAYASIAGVSPVVGLYAAPPALILYAAFGSSRHLIVGPMSATAALSAAAVADLVADPDDVLAFTAALALATGVLALAAGLLRLGFLSNFISEPVLKGFIIGMALTIIIGQVPKLLGIEKEGDNFFEQLWHVVTDLGDTHVRTLVVGVASLAIVLGLRRLAPTVPGSLVAVAFGIAAVAVLDLASEGVAIVGSISSGLPSFGPPDGLGLDDYLATAASAAGIMLVGFAEGLGAAKTYAAREHYEVDPNRELVGLGAANLASGLSSGMVVNGSLSKTAVNGGAGAKSQVSGLIVAALAVLTLLFLTALFEDLPEATLAAVVIAAVIELVDVPALRQLHRTYTTDLGRIYGHAARPDFIAAVAALLGVLVFDTLPGLFIGIATSLVLLLYRTSIPNVAELGALAHDGGRFVDLTRNPESTRVPGVVVLRVEAGMFFANAEAVRRAVRTSLTPETTLVVLDAETVPYVDVTAVRMLGELADDLARDGVDLAVARGIGQVRDVVRATDDVDIHLFPTAREAIAALHRPGDAPPR